MFLSSGDVSKEPSGFGRWEASIGGMAYVVTLVSDAITVSALLILRSATTVFLMSTNLCSKASLTGFGIGRSLIYLLVSLNPRLGTIM